MDLSSIANFTAIDFETANGSTASICQVGLVRVEGGQIVKTIDMLIQPPGNTYHWGNVRVHGIKEKDTAKAPTFDLVWPMLAPYIIGEVVVAHNVPFDAKCLRDTLKYYKMDIPEFKTECTVKIYKRNLAYLAEKYGIELIHHNALSDAKACATLYLKYLKEGKPKD